jgi:hypothetical protein
MIWGMRARAHMQSVQQVRTAATADAGVGRDAAGGACGAVPSCRNGGEQARCNKQQNNAATVSS